MLAAQAAAALQTKALRKRTTHGWVMGSAEVGVSSPQMPTAAAAAHVPSMRGMTGPALYWVHQGDRMATLIRPVKARPMLRVI